MKSNREKQGGPKLLTTREFCERLGMSNEWGRKKIQRNQISYVRIGRSVRISEDEVDRFITANIVPARVDSSQRGRAR